MRQVGKRRIPTLPAWQTFRIPAILLRTKPSHIEVSGIEASVSAAFEAFFFDMDTDAEDVGGIFSKGTLE
jgi:hypothetical protein